MPQTSRLTVYVGIFVLAAILLLVGFSLRISEGAVSGDSYSLTILLEDVSGLEPGNDVRIGGVLAGQVSRVSFDTNAGKAKADLDISEQYGLPVDSIASVAQSAFLGNAQVSIKFGKSTELLKEGDVLPSEEKKDLDDLIASVSDMSTEARELMSSLDKNQGETFGAIQEILEENREDIRSASKSLAEAGPKLDKLSANMEEITTNLKSGQGTLGKLYMDDSLYNDLRSFSDEASQIASDIREGNGTLAKLIYDDQLAITAEDSFKKMGNAGDEIQSVIAENRDKFDELVKSVEGIGPKLEEAAEGFRGISEKLNTDQGTLGKLINDPSLYNDAQRTVNQVGESFEASEEQGVIRSFFGVIFGALV